MNELPSFLQAAEAPSLLNLEEVGGAPVAPQSHTLTVSGLIAQEESNWCWAAVTQYVLRLVRNQSVDQQAVATKHIQDNGRQHTCAVPHRTMLGGTCRDTGCNGACNAQHMLRIVLQENGFSGTYLSAKRAPTFREIKDEIDLDRPVPCRVKWNNGFGHFVLVVGWTIDGTGAELVHVRDPGSAAHGQPISELVMLHSKFTSDYRLSALGGTINYSYKVD